MGGLGLKQNIYTRGTASRPSRHCQTTAIQLYRYIENTYSFIFIACEAPTADVGKRSGSPTAAFEDAVRTVVTIAALTHATTMITTKATMPIACVLGAAGAAAGVLTRMTTGSAPRNGCDAKSDAAGTLCIVVANASPDADVGYTTSESTMTLPSRTLRTVTVAPNGATDINAAVNSDKN